MEKNNIIARYWALEKNEVLEMLTTQIQGLSDTERQKRLEKYGLNTLIDRSKNTALQVLSEQFLSPLIWILIFAGVITGYLGEIIEAVVIFSAVGINVVFAFYQEYKAENTIEQLKSYIKNRATVFRDGELHELDAQDLVIGDIVTVSYGNRVPADGRLIEATRLRVDESILTGESLPVEKRDEIILRDEIAERKNSVFCGTYVTEGVGIFIVTATGNETEIGKIAQAVTETKRVKTPVQNAVKQISWYIFLIALVIVIMIFFLGIARGENFFDMLVLSAAVAVGAVPEALPITLTVILSVGVLAVSKKGGLIRKLSAAETLGSTTLILTDKTGTLTQAKLALEDIIPAASLHTEYLVKEKNIFSKLSHEQRAMIVQSFSNIQATVEKIGEDSSQWVYSGGAFDTIILKTIHTHAITLHKDTKGILISPFNSTNKYSISLLDDTLTILGAPDILINHSNFSQKEKEAAHAVIEALSVSGKRMIALAEKKTEGDVNSIKGLTIKGLFVFSDPLREDVVEAVADIQSKGVLVKIITGDLLGTARAIAEKVGIPTTDHEVITGDRIQMLTDDQLKELLPHIKVFARTTPEDKLRIGNLYRSLGEVVAMTGDGVNDAPALKAMDIGVSLGSASDVAKSAADMIMMDNNFKTITDTITEGYKIRSRIQKVFVYLMSNSLDEVFVIAGSLIAGLALPLTALQIIWVNILTGTLPALAFAYDEHHGFHKDRDRKIFNTRTKFLAFGIGTLSSIFLLILYMILSAIIADAFLAKSIFFVCFATYVLTISYSFKNIHKTIFEYNPFTNKRLNIANGIGFLLVIATVTVPFFQELFKVTSIPLALIWIVIAWNILNVAVVESAKWGFGRFVREG